jgi:hypothetical protein
MNWWLIYTDPDTPYLWSFDASTLPPGSLYHLLKESPLMFRAFTTRELADRFIEYVVNHEGTHCTSQCLSREEMVSELQRLQSPKSIDLSSGFASTRSLGVPTVPAILSIS